MDNIAKQIYDSLSTNERQEIICENGLKYDVSITTNNNICIIILKTAFTADKNVVDEYIKVINNDNSPMQYSFENNELKCKMCNYVDGKINKTCLKDQLTVAIANANSIMCYLQAGNSNG